MLRGRLRGAVMQVRVLLFVHIANEKKCLRVRGRLQFLAPRLGWMALSRVNRAVTEATDSDVGQALEAIDTYDEAWLDGVLLSLVVLVLLGRVQEHRPLLSKLTARRRRQLENGLSRGVRDALASPGPQRDRHNFTSWFSLRTQTSSSRSERSLDDLRVFRHTRKWTTDQGVHDSKCLAYDRKPQRVQRALDALYKDANRDDGAIVLVKEELKRLQAEEKLMECRARKYRLFPTKEQCRKLRGFMGTCRWTYNQAVAHFRKTSVSKAATLRDLYVTKTSSKTREYPDGMGPPPDWAFETPNSFRSNTLRKFEANVKSAFSNMANGSITHFNIQFKRKKANPLVMLAVDGRGAKLDFSDQHNRPLLSIPGLKDIPIRCERRVEVANEIQIIFSNGFWYAVIPQFIRPHEPDTHGRCIALDPGLRTFLTGVNLNGNIVEIAHCHVDHKTNSQKRARARLDALKARASLAQHDMAMICNGRGHRSGKQWKAYVKAKHAFNTATAKMKNCLKELHYQAYAFLTEHYDTIIPPVFRTKEMVKKSSSQTHRFNEAILSLKHYAFHQLLKAKCTMLGKTLVVCSEMYTSMTCGSCAKLHFGLGSSEVFRCPHCDHVAGRDVNAAFNILRFVCGGSLATTEICY